MTQPDERRTRILVVDDHAVVRMGLIALFETVPTFEVVGEARSVAEAIRLAEQVLPDVAVMDVRLPDGSGIEACREIRSRRPECRVAMLTSYTDEEAVVASVMAGAAGYLLKNTDPQVLIDAVDLVARGHSLLDTETTGTVLRWMRAAPSGAAPDPLAALNEQERKILPLIAEGKTNREIAAALFLSEHTVKTYLSHILRKLHLTRRSEAAAFIARRRT